MADNIAAAAVVDLIVAVRKATACQGEENFRNLIKCTSLAALTSLDSFFLLVE